MEESVIVSPTQINDDGSWQIEKLIRAAWVRTSERFISYFLAIVLSLVIFVAVFLVGGILAVALIGLSAALSLSSLGLVSALLVILVSLIGYLVLLYVGSLINLLITEIIIREDRAGVMETLAKVRPLVWDYVWLSFLMSLFLGGLFIWGLLSLFIVLILWSVWGSFVTFVFLEKRKKGLANLWLSKAVVSQRFWGIVGRMLLVNVAAFIISSILASSKNSVLELGSVLVSLIVQPFLISFSYEMYRIIPDHDTYKSPKAWVVLSALGWVLGIASIALLAGSFMTLFKSFSPQDILNTYKPLQSEQDINRFLPQNLQNMTLPNQTGTSQTF